MGEGGNLDCSGTGACGWERTMEDDGEEQGAAAQMRSKVVGGSGEVDGIRDPESGKVGGHSVTGVYRCV